MRVFSSFLLSLFCLGLLIPRAVFAQTDACACYCKGSTGAELMSGGTDDAPSADSTSSTCASTCTAAGTAMLGCYTSDQTASMPTNNLLCWTEYECTSQVSTDPNTAGLPYTWGGQDSSCLTGEGQCYAPSTPVTLGVVIEDMTTAQDLPTYVNAVYDWVVPAAALVAVVLIMIGGLQYVIARGDPKALGKAKSRITHAVEGIILLLCSYAILNLIDPGLVTLETLRLPQVRRVVYLDPTSTCEYMSAYGITVTPASGTSCGDSGSITSIDGFVGAGTPTVSVGDTCRYSACSDSLAACVSSSTADGGYACTRCANAANDTSGNPFADAPAPSTSTCASLKRDNDPSKPDEYQYCEYYDGAAGSTVDSNSCVELVYPSGDSVTSLDCARLKDDAIAGDSESCRAYDLVWAIAGILTDGTSGAYSNEIDDKNGAENDYPLLTQLCAADPCGLHPPGDTCQALIVQSAITSTICSLPILSETTPCQAAAMGDRADCVTGKYAETMQKALAGEDLSDADVASFSIQDLNGTEVDYNVTW